jgi:hypothetical protein
MNYESPYTIWWDKNIQGKYGVGFEIRKLMAMAFEGGRQSMRELTDEEIRKVADEVFKDYKNWHHYQIDFARAVIKKASEK